MPSLDDFRRTYPARPPGKTVTAIERVLLARADGLLNLDGSRYDHLVREGPPCTNTVKARLCLWVVCELDALCAEESCEFAKRHRMDKEVIKHSNLTAGGDAHCGGEMWFVDEGDRIVINGCSGRYGPRSPKELEDVAAAFRGMGYQVGYVPWDDEIKEFPKVTGGADDIIWL